MAKTRKFRMSIIITHISTECRWTLKAQEVNVDSNQSNDEVIEEFLSKIRERMIEVGSLKIEIEDGRRYLLGKRILEESVIELKVLS